jgi:hypothetical protein
MSRWRLMGVLALASAMVGAQSELRAQESRPSPQQKLSSSQPTMFNSKLRLAVTVGGKEFQTPAPAPGICVAGDSMWSVRPGDVVGPFGPRFSVYPDFGRAALIELVDEIKAHSVPGLSLMGCPSITDDDLEIVARASNLRCLYLDSRTGMCGPRINGPGLEHLRKLTHLKVLSIRGLGATRWGGASLP